MTFSGRSRLSAIHLDLSCLKGLDFVTPLRSPERPRVYSSVKTAFPYARNLKGTLGIAIPLLFSFLSGAKTRDFVTFGPSLEALLEPNEKWGAFLPDLPGNESRKGLSWKLDHLDSRSGFAIMVCASTRSPGNP